MQKSAEDGVVHSGLGATLRRSSGNIGSLFSRKPSIDDVDSTTPVRPFTPSSTLQRPRSRSRAPEEVRIQRGLTGGRRRAASLSRDGRTCRAMCLAQGFDLAALENAYRDPTTSSSSSTDDKSSNIPVKLEQLQLVRLDAQVLMLKIGAKDCFAFEFGCIAWWYCGAKEVKVARQAVAPFLIKPCDPHAVEEDDLVMTADLLPGEAGENGEEPRLPNRPNRQSPIFEKLALGYALAQSVRLQSLESAVDRSIEKTRAYPKTMALTGRVNLSGQKLAMAMGEIFSLRCQVNLHTDILDTPEIFWDHERYEPQYTRCRAHLDIDDRVAILNDRLEILKELYTMLQRELNTRHEHRLEYIIIFLIIADIVIMALRLVRGFVYDGTWSW